MILADVQYLHYRLNTQQAGFDAEITLSNRGCLEFQIGKSHQPKYNAVADYLKPPPIGQMRKNADFKIQQLAILCDLFWIVEQ